MVKRPHGWMAARALCAVLALTHAVCGAAVDYIRDVKPLFAQHCYRCHGAVQQKGGLRMDTAAEMLKGGDNGPGYKPGQSKQSLLVQALNGTHDEISQMPYKKPPLPEDQIALIARWIDEGAKAPADEAPESRQHWAFIAPKKAALPVSSPAASGVQHPIDAFVLARLEREKIKPSPHASRTTLIRRLSLDLIGLPPTPEEVKDFLNDQRPDAYERLVDRLLASSHYGERWGRWWLDAARYGDSNGYSIDAPRQIWKYRDWVIAALNRDLPFDQFGIEQLAGDLLPGATLDQKTATGFNRNTQINQEGGIDPEQFRVESVMDRVNTFGTVFLGLTVGCAQCHDHKFDPISQREYYELYAFFNNTVDDGHGKSTPGGMLEFANELESAESTAKELEEARAELERYLDTKGSAVTTWEQGLKAEQRSKLASKVKSAMKGAWSERTLEQKRTVYGAFMAADPEFKSRNSKVASLEKKKARPVTTLIMQELEKPRTTAIFTKGDFTRPADKVSPGVFKSMHPLKAQRADDAKTLNRLDLAKWVFESANPLTARVVVNRVWQQYFGRGLVETENDFGTQGAAPSHPELLDWLALEFQSPASGTPWSLKRLHRLIVTSATYKQDSRVREELASSDPVNKLLARQTRLRLDAELVRDSALTASGLLSRKMGGPPVYPPQPDGVMALGQVKRTWTPSTGEDRYRRGIYTHFWRATPHPALAVFDAADGFTTCTRRIRSNTPLQALTLLNDEQFHELARALGERLMKAPLADDTKRLQHGFQLCVARTPEPKELERLQALLTKQMETEKGSLETRRREAWNTVARVLLNLDETITRE